MKMKRFFYDSTVNFKNVSVSKIILAIIIGICSAITIYSFFYVLRETFRFMSTGFDNTPQILSVINRNYYNLFFAGLSVIFGNSIAMNFVFSKPQNITHRFNSKRKRLLNDQIFLGFNFSYWFGKIGLMFGVFSMCCMEFEFLPYFKHISFLLLAVLYLESQKSLGMLLRNNQRWKFILMHFLTLLLLTFSLSKLDVVDYKKIDKVALSKNPIIDFPFSKFNNDDSSVYNLSYNLKIKRDDNGIVSVFAHDKKWQLKDVHKIIKIEHASRRIEEIPFIRVNIIADKNINIKIVKKIELELLMSKQKRISYIIKMNEPLFPKYQWRGIKRRISPDVIKLDRSKSVNDIPFPFMGETKEYNKRVEIIIGEKILFDDIEVNNYEELINKFIKLHSNETIFEYRFQENTVYQDYINVFSAHFSAVNSLRKENQTVFRKHRFERNDLYKMEQRKLKELFPLLILERFD